MTIHMWVAGMKKKQIRAQCRMLLFESCLEYQEWYIYVNSFSLKTGDVGSKRKQADNSCTSTVPGAEVRHHSPDGGTAGEFKLAADARGFCSK